MYFGFGLSLVFLVNGLVSGIDVQLDSSASLKDASSTIAYDMMKSYTGNNTGDNPGNLPPPYYWWEAGAMFMHMVDYYYCRLLAVLNPLGCSTQFADLNDTDRHRR